ncbi:sensor histidine kinase [Spirosoma pomorum]
MNRLLAASRTELYFFSIVFVLFPILTMVEFGVNEPGATYPAWPIWVERVLYGILDSLPYWLYYKLILPTLFAKRYGSFTWQLGLFIVLLDVYQHYLVYGLVMQAQFLPNELIKRAQRWYKAPVVLHFSIIYVLRQLLMVTALGYYRRATWQQQKLHELSQYQLQAELDSLKSQLQPHFFFNTLNNMYSLALQQSAKTAPLIAQHAHMMRYVLQQAKSHRVPLRDEIDFLANYVAVESVRFSEQTSIQFETQGIRSDVFIEPLLLLPLLENTFKHGLHQEITTGFVRILVVLQEQDLILETHNSKLGRVTESNRSGIGLQTTQKRLSLLYPGLHEWRIQEDECTYTLYLCITLSSHD